MSTAVTLFYCYTVILLSKTTSTYIYLLLKMSCKHICFWFVAKKHHFKSVFYHSLFSLFAVCLFFVLCASDLRYDSQTLPQAVKADVPDILPRYVDVSLLGLTEAEQQPHNGALPTTRHGTNHLHNSTCELYSHSKLMTSDKSVLQMRWHLAEDFNISVPTLTRCLQL